MRRNIIARALWKSNNIRDNDASVEKMCARIIYKCLLTNTLKVFVRYLSRVVQTRWPRSTATYHHRHRHRHDKVDRKRRRRGGQSSAARVRGGGKTEPRRRSEEFLPVDSAVRDTRFSIGVFRRSSDHFAESKNGHLRRSSEIAMLSCSYGITLLSHRGGPTNYSKSLLFFTPKQIYVVYIIYFRNFKVFMSVMNNKKIKKQ